MRIGIIAALIVAAQLIACGSGAKSPSAPAAVTPSPGPTPSGGIPWVHFEGVWQGTITPDNTMSSLPAIAIVNGWGELRLLADDAQFVGFGSRTDSELNGDLMGFRLPGSTWSDGTRVSPFTISGSIDEAGFIDAAYSGNADSGSIALAWESSNNSGDIDATNGTWVLFDDNLNPVATFDFIVKTEIAALIIGTHSNGCTFSGGADSWTSFTSYNISDLQISNCPLVSGINVNGGYSGTVAILDVADDGTNQLSLVLGLSNDEIQLTYFLYRP